MGWSTVAHLCGHQSQQQLFGKQSRREWLMDQMASKPCADCMAAERSAHAARCADEAQALGLPRLQGSAKQVAWAEALRHELYQQLDQEAHEARSLQCHAHAALILATKLRLAERVSAAAWIDARSTTLDTRIAGTAHWLTGEKASPLWTPEERRAWLSRAAGLAVSLLERGPVPEEPVF